jgi:hypothetical protein
MRGWKASKKSSSYKTEGRYGWEEKFVFFCKVSGQTYLLVSFESCSLRVFDSKKKDFDGKKEEEEEKKEDFSIN